MARTTEAFIIGACASETVSRERLFGQSYGWRNGRARVRLEADILPEMPGHYAVAISIGPWRGTIELFKLAL
jgi:hypothetical protein